MGERDRESETEIEMTVAGEETKYLGLPVFSLTMFHNQSNPLPVVSGA